MNNIHMLKAGTYLRYSSGAAADDCHLVIHIYYLIFTFDEVSMKEQLCLALDRILKRKQHDTYTFPAGLKHQQKSGRIK